VTYIQNSQAWDTQPHPAITDSEPDAFVVSKLAELVVVLFRDHVPREGSGLRERAGDERFCWLWATQRPTMGALT
jgi:hypothetical protein